METLMSSIKRMTLECKKYFFILLLDFQAILRQLPKKYKSLIKITFDGNTLKMKAAGPIQVINNKKQCFKWFFNQTRVLVLHARISQNLK